MDLRDTLRSPQRAKAAAQPDISKTTHSTNQDAHIGSRASVNKTYAAQKNKDAGSTAPSLGEVADPSTPSIGSSFSDLDSMLFPAELKDISLLNLKLISRQTPA